MFRRIICKVHSLYLKRLSFEEQAKRVGVHIGKNDTLREVYTKVFLNK